MASLFRRKREKSKEELIAAPKKVQGVRVVLDTNLFIAAYWNPESASAEILRACLQGQAVPYYTRQMRRELVHILRNIRASENYRREVEKILEHGKMVESPGRLAVITDDPEDNKFLECALVADANYLVTNDIHLTRLGQFGNVKIVRPSAFHDVLDKEYRQVAF